MIWQRLTDSRNHLFAPCRGVDKSGGAGAGGSFNASLARELTARRPGGHKVNRSRNAHKPRKRLGLCSGSPQRSEPHHGPKNGLKNGFRITGASPPPEGGRVA